MLQPPEALLGPERARNPPVLGLARRRRFLAIALSSLLVAGAAAFWLLADQDLPEFAAVMPPDGRWFSADLPRGVLDSELADLAAATLEHLELMGVRLPGGDAAATLGTRFPWLLRTRPWRVAGWDGADGRWALLLGYGGLGRLARFTLGTIPPRELDAGGRRVVLRGTGGVFLLGSEPELLATIASAIDSAPRSSIPRSGGIVLTLATAVTRSSGSQAALGTLRGRLVSASDDRWRFEAETRREEDPAADPLVAAILVQLEREGVEAAAVPPSDRSGGASVAAWDLEGIERALRRWIDDFALWQRRG